MKITFKSVLIGLAGILGIVGFCMMFLSPITVAPGLNPAVSGILNEMGFNDGKVAFDTFYFGSENVDGHILGVIGFVLMLVGAIAAIAVAFISKKPKVYIWVLILGILAAALLAVGGILALCVKADMINEIMSRTIIQALPENIKQATADQLNELLALGTGPMVGGILGLAGAVLAILGSILPGPKAKKGKK